MNTSPGRVQAMMRTYGRQLTSAKRLARFRKALMLAQGRTEPLTPRDIRRKQLVERVAREIIENLIVSGSENPVVGEIQTELNQRFGQELLFEYPLDGDDLRILRMTDQGPQVLPPPETGEVMKNLWDITLQKVDETML